MNWVKTKSTFGGIYTAVCTSRDHLKQRLERFKTHLDELSNPARARFEQHIGFVLAKHASVKELAKQEEWFEGNKSNIKFDDYFSNVDSPVLKEAVKNFQKELESKA